MTNAPPADWSPSWGRERLRTRPRELRESKVAHEGEVGVLLAAVEGRHPCADALDSVATYALFQLAR